MILFPVAEERSNYYTGSNKPVAKAVQYLSNWLAPHAAVEDGRNSEEDDYKVTCS